MATDQSTVADPGKPSDKNPIVAAVLSWFVPGVGHYYLGDSNRALKVFLAVLVYYVLSFVLLFVGVGLLMLFVAPLVHIAAGVDAYLQGNK